MTNINDGFKCAGNIFEVIKWDIKPSGSESGCWEKPASSIKFEFGNCEEKSEGEKKECSIKVSDGIELKISQKFKSKLIFRESSSTKFQ